MPQASPSHSQEPPIQHLASAQAPPSPKGSDDKEINYFKSAEWSPDGTCLLTNSADNHIRTWIVPPTLLEDHSKPLELEPYSCIPSFESVNCVACYPSYNLQDPSTTLLLSAASEHPIRLNSALTGHQVASYPLVSATTEAHIRPQSLTYTSSGSHFVVGSNSLISSFDLSRPGDGPLTSLKTGPKNRKSSWSNPNASLRGLISALNLDQQYNVLAAGTFNRGIGLYDAGGQGDCVGTFSVAGTEGEEAVLGSGITQLLWTKCGRYLYVVERNSNGALIYDIRKTGQLLSWIAGRQAVTNQRMHVELAATSESGDENLWAGGVDGNVRSWRAPHHVQGLVETAQVLKCHNDAVNSVGMHKTAHVLLTAAGQRAFANFDKSDELGNARACQEDEILKLWSILKGSN